MSAAHTPGPWVARFGEAYVVTGPDLGRVAMMMNLKGQHGLGGRRSGEEVSANARLISAAPELLDALRRAVFMLEAWHAEFPDDVGHHEAPALHAARAAILKATGSAT